jgi:glycosyltransferase A (GT-A) superfamily protein (DUF2064 family)
METDIETGQGSQVIVIAEAPAPERVDDWLSPPLRPQQAALVAEAALADTLEVVAAAPVTRRVLALDGAPGDWLPDGFRVIGQRGSGLDERIAAAFADAYAVAPLPMVLIGTDTPQVTVDMLADAAASLESGEADAVFGPSTDGGFWMLGLRRPDRSLLAGVPMSAQDPGRVLLERLAGAGLRVALAPRLTEVSTFEAAGQVAGECPSSRFAAAVSAVASGLTTA